MILRPRGYESKWRRVRVVHANEFGINMPRDIAQR